MDGEWRFIFLNRQAEKLFQASRRELIFKNVWDTFPELVDSAFYEYLQRAAHTTLPTTFEIFYQPACTWLEVQARPMEGELSVYLTTVAKRNEEVSLPQSATVVHAPSQRGMSELIATNRRLQLELAERRREEEAAHQHRQLATALVEAAVALNRSLDLDEVLDCILDQALRVIPCDAANLMLIEDGFARVVRFRGYGKLHTLRWRLPSLRVPLSYPGLQRMLLTRQPLLIRDTTKDPFWQPTLITKEIRSYVGTPLVADGAILGFLNLDSDKVDFFPEEAPCRLQAFAAQAAIAIQNARLYRNLQETVRQKQLIHEQLIQADKLASMGKLVASLAHEINNPLQAVRGCLALAKEQLEEQPAGSAAHYVSVAESEIERISTIVMRMRDFYLPNRDMPRTADPHRVIHEVTNLIAHQLHHHGIQLITDLADYAITVPCNPDHLKQVFLNLLLNAIDAMMEIGGTLTIRTRQACVAGTESGNHPSIKVEVIDTGTGIPPEEINKVFRPFFSGKQHGSGLGLSISQGIIQSYDGQMAVESRYGQGTTFMVILPAGETDRQEEE